MHIPSGATSQLEQLSFAEALRLAEQPCQQYDVHQWLYVPNFYADYRYILGTRGERPLICVGINPSTAAPDDLDPTLKSVERIALHNGFDSFIMFNVYAQRATRPEDMEAERNPTLHAENMNAFRHILSLSAHYLADCVRDMIQIGTEFGAQWFSAGRKSKKGHPHHPLYLKRDSPLDPFDISYYVDQILTPQDL